MALNKEISVLSARIDGKRRAGLEGGEDANLLAEIEKYKESLNEST